MAIDTRDKRASAILLAILPLADGAALNIGDRQQVAWLYRGIETGVPATFAIVTEWLPCIGADGSFRTLHGSDSAFATAAGANSGLRSLLGADSGFADSIGADNRMRTLTDD